MDYSTNGPEDFSLMTFEVGTEEEEEEHYSEMEEEYSEEEVLNFYLIFFGGKHTQVVRYFEGKKQLLVWP